MGEETTTKERKDFFISYTSTDLQWAEWIAWKLEEAGYHTIIQAWHFHAGDNFVQRMDDALKQAEWVLAVFSPDYFDSRYATDEWRAAYRGGKLLPVQIRECREQLTGLLGPIVYIDLVGLEEEQARERLLAQICRKDAKPKIPPRFPFGAPTLQERPTFPGAFTIRNISYLRNPFFTGRENLLTNFLQQLPLYPCLVPKSDLPFNSIASGFGNQRPFDLLIRNDGTTSATNIWGILIEPDPAPIAMAGRRYTLIGKTSLQEKMEENIHAQEGASGIPGTQTIGPYTLFAPQDLIVTEGVIGRLTLTYQDAFGQKYASIFNYHAWGHRWSQVDFFPLQKEMHDIQELQREFEEKSGTTAFLRGLRAMKKLD